jgi:hypothetical protein
MVFALFFSQPEVFSGSWVELVGTISLVTLLFGAYRRFECHVSGCHRIGRFPHGHYKLCHVHHPQVPDDGKITAERVKALHVNDSAASPTPTPRSARPLSARVLCGGSGLQLELDLARVDRDAGAGCLR